MLQRIQLLLDNETKKELKQTANRENRSVSAVAREILYKNLKKNKSVRTDGGTSFLLALADKAVAGPGNAEYDAYAYEK